jgi:prepilin-type N-terminal cleavage/methylation domain-containing protein
MIFHRLRKVIKKQDGFTLIELVMALTISAVISGTITATIFQVITGSGRTNNHMVAIRNAQEAGFEISRDAQQARRVEPAAEAVDNPDGTRFPLVLTWTDWEGVLNTVTYKIEDTELQRKYNDGGWGCIAQYVNPDPTMTYCDFTDGKLTFQVTVTVGSGSEEQNETRVYEVVPRPSWR